MISKTFFILSVVTIIILTTNLSLLAQSTIWEPLSNAPSSSFWDLTAVGDTLLGVTSDAAYQSTDEGDSWTKIGNFSNAGCIAAGDGRIFVGAGSGLFRSLNDGVTWDSLAPNSIGPIVLCGKIILEALSDAGIYRSTDNGNTWSVADSGLSGTSVRTLFVRDSTIFAGTVPGSNGVVIPVLSSSDSGASWHECSNGICCISNVTMLAQDSSYLYFCAGYVYRSNDNGLSWDLVENPVDSNWSSAAWPICTGLGSVWACFQGYGVLQSTDHGDSWTRADSGLGDFGDIWVQAIAAVNHSVFAATENGGVYRAPARNLSSVFSSKSKTIVLDIYPDPATESVTISFTPETSGYADVSIVNLLGTEVAHIFSGELAAGAHPFTWEPSALPDGMYECLVRMNGQAQTLVIMLEH
jgi:photosystem II stability/assembly factor-like uncharacterized protein